MIYQINNYKLIHSTSQLEDKQTNRSSKSIQLGHDSILSSITFSDSIRFSTTTRKIQTSSNEQINLNSNRIIMHKQE